MLLLIASTTDCDFQTYQLDCMRKLVSIQNVVTLERIIPQGTPEDVCRWWHVSCNDNRHIVSIHWHFNSPAIPFSMHIEWLPSSLRDVTMRFDADGSQFQTRLLPRMLVNAEFEECYFQGCIELRTLPQHLRKLSVARNNFSGTVHLTHLPQKFRRLCMDGNKITRIVVSKIPESLHLATFRDNPKVKITWLDRDGIDTRVKIEHDTLEYLHQSDHMDDFDFLEPIGEVLRPRLD
mmetsp:Transcript_8443/g.12759  ORF Transcript_8443/g.12759 Transcript_8443/m.12759 type:complete len:235 (-) Transcript_8443:35-739(-)